MIDPDTPTSQNMKYPHWQHALEAALLERDPQKLRQRVDAAEAAIFLRLQNLTDNLETQAEHEASGEAIRTLRAFQKEKLGYPDWNKK